MPAAVNHSSAVPGAVLTGALTVTLGFATTFSIVSLETGGVAATIFFQERFPKESSDAFLHTSSVSRFAAEHRLLRLRQSRWP